MRKIFKGKNAPFSVTLFVAVLFCVTGNAQVLTPLQNKAITQARQGEIVNLDGFLSTKIPFIDYQKLVLPGPQFIISDDPEYIHFPEAIALQENVEPGTVRLYAYNVNGVTEPRKMDRKIVALLKNTGKGPMHVRMLKYSSQVPSSNYFNIGKEGLADYFNSEIESKVRSVAPGEVIAIDEKQERYIVKYDDLVHGLYEFVIDQHGEIAIAQMDPAAKSTEALDRIKKIIPLSHENAGRGVFGISNYQIITRDVYNTASGPVQIMLADGKVDPWVTGIEGVSGEQVHLSGNYGVMYDIEVKWKSTDGKGLAFITWDANAGSNQWCNGMGTSMVVSKGKFKAGIVHLPVDSLITKGAPEGIVIQVFPPSKDAAEQTIHIKYSPPGASCLPVPLVLVPVDVN